MLMPHYILCFSAAGSTRVGRLTSFTFKPSSAQAGWFLAPRKQSAGWKRRWRRLHVCFAFGPSSLSWYETPRLPERVVLLPLSCGISADNEMSAPYAPRSTYGATTTSRYSTALEPAFRALAFQHDTTGHHGDSTTSTSSRAELKSTCTTRGQVRAA